MTARPCSHSCGAKSGTRLERRRQLAAIYAIFVAAAIVLVARTQIRIAESARSQCRDGAGTAGCRASAGGQRLLAQGSEGGRGRVRLVKRSAIEVEWTREGAVVLEEASEEQLLQGAGGNLPAQPGEHHREEQEPTGEVTDGSARPAVAAAGAGGQPIASAGAAVPASSQRAARGPAEAAGPGQAASQQPAGAALAGAAGRPQRASPYQQAVAQCVDLPCLTRAASLERAPGQMRFPHFFIVGFQKCATTSLYWHLGGHPQVLSAKDKEPEFFSDECGYDPGACSKAAQHAYLHTTLRLPEAMAAGLTRGAMEASTHYGRNGHLLAGPMRQVFPWLKVVVSMREPISRSLSMLAHLLDKHDYGCLTRNSVFTCVEKDLRRDTYAVPLRAWLDAFPSSQLFLIQYENITSNHSQPLVLRDLKNYLEIDPELPHSDLGLRNTRELHLQRKGTLREGQEADGWTMKKWQYKALVELVRPDAQKVADLADEFGLADGRQWMANWEAEWKANLSDCKDGSCTIHPN